MDHDWSWKDLPVVAPVIGSSFAFAYVVGYFYAFDIAWFPFFSLPEHLVLALRALPMAIAASVVFLIALSPVETRWKWLRENKRWFVFGWIVILIMLAALALVSKHIGLGISVLGIAFGTWVYHSRPTPPSSSLRILYWATTLIVSSLIFGFSSGSAYRIPKNFRYERCVSVDTDSNHWAGHLIAAGALSVLIYDYPSKEVQLVRRETITRMGGSACPAESTNKPKSGN
jgi:hypothetical protein